MSTPDTVQVETVQAVIEGFVDGILILTEYGGWVQANTTAQQLCRQLVPQTATSPNKPIVPKVIWEVCAALIDSRSTFREHQFILESEIVTPAQVKLRVRAQWLSIDTPYLLVVLEDCQQSSKNFRDWSARKYGLTDRQAEVWALRRRGCSYAEIGRQLYITQNTVKKHLKDIYAKIREVEDWQDSA
ncbi:helix-turn-helix transcriptional regulator [Microcoleus sp. FACHB-1515]|uniref:helix-turn-helix transcriptional regulator n=1 Tax=Cyanophyceae TaxID=3028117 RepID=UPI001689E1B0|nr:helix-turn-helix transcriptional regulator [Microcoleus sp. FACHB-1515]MBD2088901.1 helix-turn-helix transcriptional regulator [Microcoleus sp. FACHB-1515]